MAFQPQKRNCKRIFVFSAKRTKSRNIFKKLSGVFIPFKWRKKEKGNDSRSSCIKSIIFSIACVMNYQPCIDAMRWFRESIYFSKDYTDIPSQLLEHAEDMNMLKAIVSYAKQADVGIEDMSFEIRNEELSANDSLPNNLPGGIVTALKQFALALKDSSEAAEMNLQIGEVKTSSMHRGLNQAGEEELFTLELSDESDGTRRLMSLAPGIERVLQKGGLLMVDEIDRELHPLLVEFIISKFQSPKTNPGHAQIIFTTHDTELLNMEILRKDQVYFVDKNKRNGVSELFNLTDLPVRTNDNIRKAYLVGKYGAVPDVDTLEVE